LSAAQHDWFEPGTRDVSQTGLKRYSLFVNGMKLALPAIAVGIVVAIMASSASNPAPPPPRKVSALESTMQAPSYASRDDKGQPYKLDADVAKQDPAAPDVMDLTNPKAEIELNNGSTLEGAATTGQYNQKEGKLDINGDLTLHHSSGAVFETSKATVDINAKSASGDAPVHVTGDFGEVNAKGFQLINEGKVVIFTGPSTARLKLGGSNGSPMNSIHDLIPSNQPPLPKTSPKL
jgi:lipopolysaccharide export system protein LptC